MRSGLVLALAAAAALLAPSAGAATALSARTAERALVHRLERYQGFRAATAACHLRTRREQRCTWRGRRADGAWKGTARVRRLSGGALDVKITSARRA